MKVLIVCSGNSGNVAPFVKEQANALNNLGVETVFFVIKGKGILGYFKNLPALNQKIIEVNPDLIHAHYGLSGLLSTLQSKKKVIITFHGTDLNDFDVRFFSKLAHNRASASIFVSKSVADRTNSKNPLIIPCGIYLNVFYPIDKEVARKKLNYDLNENLVLFSSSFNNKIKNYTLANKSIQELRTQGIKLKIIELRGYSRAQVNLLLNAVDLALLTSFSEGSSQFIKEAMACNRPIISTNVGDVKWLLGENNGGFIVDFDSAEIAEKIKLILQNNVKVNLRDRILELKLDSQSVANKIFKLYQSCLK